MSDCYSGPYRATALWNEAVLLFRENMILKEHRHRFHKHKNSFTGHQGVTLLLNVLCSNPMFNSSISREQCCRLLRQFLKANLISPVKNCSLSHSKTTFYDSNKYLYEFTDQLIHFEPLQPISLSNTYEPKIEKPKNILDIEKCYSKKLDRGSVWKSEIIKRVAKLVKPLDIYEISNFNHINPSWVEINADPECQKVKWNTELPDWILSAIHDLIKYTSKDYCGTTYPDFELDAFQVITGYFKTLEVPLIDQRDYDIYIAVYQHLEYLNCLEVVKSPKKIFQNESGLKNCCKRDKRISNICLLDKMLPPNHCYEAAFTSDNPTIRVVPQCSVDSIHLRNRMLGSFGGMKNAISETGIQNLSENQIYPSHAEFPQGDTFKRSRHKNKLMPLKSIDNVIFKHSSDGKKNGIVNEGFIVYSPDKRKVDGFTLHSHKNNTLNRDNIDVDDIKNLEKENQCNNFIYVNHGLSFSVEDVNLLVHDHLDYNFALESLNNLMKVTQYNQSISDDDHSFHTALSLSEFDISDKESYSGDIHTHHSSETEWDPGIIELGNHIFQLLLIFLPPSNRAKLKHLCLLLNKLTRNLCIPQLTLNNMLLKLDGCVLRPVRAEASDFSTVNNILTFIINNYKTIFAELPSDLLSNIRNELYEKELKKFTSSDKASNDVSNIQKTEDSGNSLLQLLDHLIKNKNISEKDRRKHLKLFKDCYPEIYRSRFPDEKKPTKTRMLFSIKNLRL